MGKKFCANGTSTFTIRVESAHKSEIQAIAASQGVTPNHLARKMIALFLESQREVAIKNPAI